MMNQFFEKMCAMSNCCVSSRESKERDGSDAGPLFERRWVGVFNLSSVYLSAFARTLVLLTSPGIPTRTCLLCTSGLCRLREKGRRGVDAIVQRSTIAKYSDYDDATQSRVCEVQVDRQIVREGRIDRTHTRVLPFVHLCMINLVQNLTECDRMVQNHPF